MTVLLNKSTSIHNVLLLYIIYILLVYFFPDVYNLEILNVFFISLSGYITTIFFPFVLKEADFIG